MALQVIPGPELNGLDNLQKTANLVLAFKQQAMNEKLAQANLESTHLQNELLSQQAANYPTVFEQQQRAGEASIAEKYQNIEQSKQAVLTSKAQAFDYGLSGAERVANLAERAALFFPKLSQTLAATSEASSAAKANQLKIEDFEKAQKQLPVLMSLPQEKGGYGLDPDTASKITSPLLAEHAATNMKLYQEMKESIARTNSLATQATVAEKNYGLEKALKMTVIGQELGKQALTDPEGYQRTLELLPADVAGPIRAMKQVLDTNSNFLQIETWARMSSDPEVQAAASGLEAAKHPANWQDAPRTVSTMEGMVTIPSSEQNIQRYVNVLTKKYNQSTGKGPTTKPVTTPLDQPALDAVQGIQEKRLQRQVVQATSNRFEALDKQVNRESFGKITGLGGEAGDTYINEELPTQTIPQILKTVPQERKQAVSQALDQLEPVDTASKDMSGEFQNKIEPVQKRARFFELVRQAFQTQRPGLVFDTFWKKYGAQGITPEDQDVLNGIMQAMGWNWSPPASSKGK